MLDFARAQPSHEDVFMDHYAALLKRAGHLVRGAVARAEDLVHDAFVQFTLVRPPLAEIQHVEAYLAGMLRNMHASAQRRAARRSETSLDLLDLDSLDEGWHTVGRTAMLEARGDLELLCRYACQRRLSSKAGSILILRFFHGYFPAEIARITGMTARSVDEWVRVARREAKLLRDAPDHVSFLSDSALAAGQPPSCHPPPGPTIRSATPRRCAPRSGRRASASAPHATRSRTSMRGTRRSRRKSSRTS